MVGVMKCSHCGKIVHLSSEQYKLIGEMWKISSELNRVIKDMERTGMCVSFDMNILRAVDKIIKCCDDPLLLWSRSY